MLSHAEITTLLISVGLLLGLARILAEVARRVGQPSVVGEILAGVLLGPTVLGTIWPEGKEALFPSTGGLPAARSALTTLSVTLFLLVAGMELDLTKILKRRRAAVLVSLGGITVPFALGWLPAYLAPQWMGAGEGITPTLFALFVGTAMAISALPVIAKILMDLHLFKTELGATIIAAAVIDDLCGWVIFGVILALMGTQAGHAASAASASAGTQPAVWLSALLVVGFAAGMLTIGRWLINGVLPWVQAHTAWPGGVLGFALVGCVLCAAFTEWIGVHAIFGAFFFGVALGDSRHLRTSTRTTIDQFVSFIFAPLFFASIGLRVNFATNFDLLLVVVVLVIACVGKFTGCATAGRLAGLPRKESLAIAAGMNARGAMEIILGLLALEAGLISDRLFVALVVMALVTSMAAGTMMQRFLGRSKSVRFVDYASGKTFVAPVPGRTRVDAVADMGRIAAEAGKVDVQMAVDAALAREQVLHSGVGHGVAVPHARVAGLSQAVVAIGLSPEGIAWGSRDGRAVRVIVFLLTPEQDARLHLDLLASIATTLRDPATVDLAATAKTWTEFLAAIKTSGAENSSR